MLNATISSLYTFFRGMLSIVPVNCFDANRFNPGNS